MSAEKPPYRPSIRNVVVDYRLSTYQPMAYVETHSHAVQEQIHHVLEGEGAMEIDGKKTIGDLTSSWSRRRLMTAEPGRGSTV